MTTKIPHVVINVLLIGNAGPRKAAGVCTPSAEGKRTVHQASSSSLLPRCHREQDGSQNSPGALRTLGRGSGSCRICSARRGLTRKYGLSVCHHVPVRTGDGAASVGLSDLPWIGRSGRPPYDRMLFLCS